METLDTKKVKLNDGTSFTHLLVAATTVISKKDGDKLIAAWKRGNWNIVFQVEGVDVPIKDVMDEWERQLDRMLAEKAMELFRAKTGNLLDSLEELLKETRRSMAEKIEKELGVKLPEEED